MVLPEKGGSVNVEPEEIKKLLYTPTLEEWVGRHSETECDRIARGISLIMELAVAEPFLAPVDLNVYPNYAMIIEYPMDLSTIKVSFNFNLILMKILILNTSITL